MLPSRMNVNVSHSVSSKFACQAYVIASLRCRELLVLNLTVYEIMARHSQLAGRPVPSYLRQQSKRKYVAVKPIGGPSRALKRKARESSDDESDIGHDAAENPAASMDSEGSESLEDESEDEFAGDRARAARWVDEDELDHSNSSTHGSSSGDEAPSVKDLVSATLRSLIEHRRSRTSVLRCNVAVNQKRHAS